MGGITRKTQNPDEAEKSGIGILLGIGIGLWVLFAVFLIWAIFFPSQAFLKLQANRANTITVVHSKSLESGILISERISFTRFSTGRIVTLTDDGTMYSRYFNRPRYIRGISGRLVWTTAPNGLSLELPTLKNGPLMKNIIADCAVNPVEVEIDSLGLLQVTREDGIVVACNPGYGAGVSPVAKRSGIRYGTSRVRLVRQNRVSRVAFDGNIVSGQLLKAEFIETITSGGHRQKIFVEEEPLIEFQRSLSENSPRHVGRYSSQGTRWETRLGNNETAITQLHSCFLRGQQLIVLGYNMRAETCAVAIDIKTGETQWEKKIR